jgi:hypothetical protein
MSAGWIVGVALAVALAVTGRSAAAQGYPFSQRGEIRQRVAHTELRIEYGRPSARGRVLWGTLVPWDAVWHPGADDATEISISHDIQLEGQRVAKGAYTAWLIPRASGPWTFILNRATKVSHTPYPGAATEAVRVDAMPEQLSHVETVTFAFPLALRDDAVLRLQWGTQGISLRIKAPYVPPDSVRQ